MPITIRDAAPADTPAILLIEQFAPSAAHWSAEQYNARIQESSVIVAEQEAEICGFLCARIVAGEWEIENVVVAPAFRRQGIAAALMQSFIAKWQADAGESIHLEVRESNHAARALYEKSGLREVGRRRGYYRDPVEDAVLYSRPRSL